MKIRTRLALTFYFISSTIFLIFGITVYIFFSDYRKQDFQDRLEKRVIITEKIFLEKETFSPSELEKINNQFLHTLPEETEEVILIEKDKQPVFKHDYPEEVLTLLVSNNTFEFEDNYIQGASRIFQVGGKNYLIIVTAVDKVGHQNLSFLKRIIIFLVLIGISLIFVCSFIITKRALLPISKKIEKANTISASNLHQRLNVQNPNDEIGIMAIAFNKLLDRLEASFDAQKSFIQNASHEIKNPLTSIMGEAEVILSKARTKDEYKESLNIILSESETLSSTVSNLLQLAKVTSGEENINFETIIFDEFLNEVKFSFDFINPDNQVNLNIFKTTKEKTYSISGNKNLLKTVIINLLDNACKFSSNGHVDILLSNDDEHLNLEIKDEGIGINSNDLNKITTPFYRGNNTIQIKGSGIGLSLCSKIINLHSGKIQIESQIDIGTTVHIKIPLISA